MSDTAQKIVMIVGAGRSGSTLLSQLLGEVNGWFAVGELKYLWDAGFGRNQLCACGTALRDCDFWTEVLSNVVREDLAAIAKFAVLRDRVGHRTRLLQLMYPWIRSNAFEEALYKYACFLEEFVRAVARTSRSSVIVDASKDPAHALVYLCADNVDLRVVHLIRDPRAVAHSKGRRKQKTAIKTHKEYMPTGSAVATSLGWSTVNLASWLALRTSDSYLQVNYEDLVRDPSNTILQIIEFSGEPRTTLPFIQGRQASISRSHTALGNPSRSSGGTVRIRLDDAWVAEMSTVRKVLVAAVTWPVDRVIRQRSGQ